ncbi:hypothetical protein [Streptomyces syringium]|uniref:hypothetical protein n=1 Tax=Streptomyces syringium TaxID=76729 RepID=UPI0034514612
MVADNADGKLYPYENKNWAMLVKADPDHPLKPGTKTGGMVVLIQNIGGTARKLNSYIGLTYRTSTALGQVVFTSPWEKADELNADTAVGGTFAPDGLPGDKVFLALTPPVTEGSKVQAVITSIEQDRKVWSFLPRDGWEVGQEYIVTAWAEGDEHPSAPVARKFKAVAPKPSVTILTPGREGAEISQMTRLTGSYGGTVKQVGGITILHNGSTLTVRQDYPEKGIWTVEPPTDGWALGDGHRIEVQANNGASSSDKVTRNFQVSKVKPGKPRITVPPTPVADYYSTYKPPSLAGVVDRWMQFGSSLGPCDKVTVTDPKQPERTMTAKLEYDSVNDSYQWSLDTDWIASDEGVRHDVVATAWLGDERSEDAKISFVMKTPAAEDNPIQFTSPQHNAPEADSHVELKGTALMNTPNVTISERGATTLAELPAVVGTITDEHLTHWSWKPQGAWTAGPHTVVVTASRPNQKNEIAFTVAGAPNIFILTPATDGLIIYDHDMINGSLPIDVKDEQVTIIDTCDGNELVFSAVNNGDRRFHYSPPTSGGGWRTGTHSLVAKAGHYTSDPRRFTVAGKKLVVLKEGPLYEHGSIKFEIPDNWDRFVIEWTDGKVMETPVTALKKDVDGKPSEYPNYLFKVYQPPAGYWKTGTYTLKCWGADGKSLGEDSRLLTVV